MDIHRSCLKLAIVTIAIILQVDRCAAMGEDDRPNPLSAQRAGSNRQVRQILSDNCFACHGPDERARKAGLRLDVPDAATQPTQQGRVAIVPGKPDASELVRRIMEADEDLRMPPPGSHKRLTEVEKRLLRDWIEHGAEYQPHWSFTPPQRPTLPHISDSAWPRNPIDHFILARLESGGLHPSPEADKPTLIRRVTLALTGLPPTPVEVESFLEDRNPDAYERLVDRLLNSPRFGERMAIDWLDAARFADTHGYHIDSGRDMSKWREWVIDAFNHNMPFDQFTVDQLAGDLRAGAAIAQQIASGFNRNHMINFEGGAIPEEYHNAYIVDRVNTTATVWLGLTIACAQCHEHKYDPITQKEYYQLYAFFHNVPENGLDGRTGNAAPVVKVPSHEQQQALSQLANRILETERRIQGPLPDVDEAQAKWERDLASHPATGWKILKPITPSSAGSATLETLADDSVLASGMNPATETYVVPVRVENMTLRGIRLEALADDSLPAHGPGRSANGNAVLTGVRAELKPIPDGAKLEPSRSTIRFRGAWADFSQKDYPVDQAIDDQPKSGWAIYPEVGRTHEAVFELDEAIRLDGAAQLVVTLDFQSQFAQHQFGRFRLSVTDSPDPRGTQRPPANILSIASTAPNERTNSQQAELRAYYRSHNWADYNSLNDQLAKLRKDQADLEKQIPTSMVMQEMDNPRATYMLIRGQYDRQGERVTADVPAMFPPLAPGAPRNRLGLAQWLVSPEQPLTARVIVNRFWQMHFGTGIVKTAEDFGTQGEWPVHPELLDWLASEFMQPSTQVVGPITGSAETPGPRKSQSWDMKHIHRLIVTSSSYRQSSQTTPTLLAADPENRLLARAPRLRLQVEFIRDQALAVSGLLDGRIGGTSVSPYQPPGIWEELASRQDGKNWTAQEYVQSHGADLYRRTMYTFIKRTAPPPSLVTFDAPDRETCTVRRARTNTPLQALVLMNDPTYVEASRKLAERIMDQCSTVTDRITMAFRLAMTRVPTDRERELTESLYRRQLQVFHDDVAAARKLLAVGESGRDERLDPAELAAWTIVANMILNLDETITRG